MRCRLESHARDTPDVRAPPNIYVYEIDRYIHTCIHTYTHTYIDGDIDMYIYIKHGSKKELDTCVVDSNRMDTPDVRAPHL